MQSNLGATVHQMKIVFNGCTNVSDGYGEIMHQLARAVAVEHEVAIIPNMTWHSMQFMKPDITAMMNRKIKDADFELFIFYPNESHTSRFRCGILSMWEGSDLPTPWIKSFNRFSNIFVPSKFVGEVLKNSGVTGNIYLLPLGIDTNLYKTKERTMPKRPFRFLSVGKMEPRKNADVLVRAFQNEFVKDDVELWIKTREKFVPSPVLQAAKNDRRIKLIEKTMTEEDLVKLYYECDCFVYPSRGEGFSFPPRNAIATGMPTIVTGWSALNEIEGAVKVPPSGFSPMHPCGFSFGEEQGILMADVNSNTLGIVMRDVYDRYDGYVSWTLKNRQIPLWSDSAEAFISAVRSML